MIQAALNELKKYQGQVWMDVPAQQVGDHDLILVQQNSTEKLLQIARTQSAQVAVLSDTTLSEELTPFVDWVFPTNINLTLLQPFLGQESAVPQQAKPKKRALFLDRDGVVNVDHGYVGNPNQVQLMPKVGELIARMKHHGFEVVVITNQSGIGRGLYSEDNFKKVMTCIDDLLAVDGAKMDRVEFSPYHPSSKNERYLLGRQFRKPRPGMFHRAREYDLAQSILIGDRATDLKAGVLAGVGKVFLFSSEQSEIEWLNFQSWIESLTTGLGLENLLNGITVKMISSLNELKRG